MIAGGEAEQRESVLFVRRFVTLYCSWKVRGLIKVKHGTNRPASALTAGYCRESRDDDQSRSYVANA